MTTDGEDTAASDSLDDTIWPQVDACLAGISCEPERGAQDLIVTIPKDELIRGLRALRQHEELAFDYLRCLSGIDWEEEGIEIVYHLYSSTSLLNLTVKTRLANDDLTVDTATSVWRGADWLPWWLRPASRQPASFSPARSWRTDSTRFSRARR